MAFLNFEPDYRVRPLHKIGIGDQFQSQQSGIIYTLVESAPGVVRLISLRRPDITFFGPDVRVDDPRHLSKGEIDRLFQINYSSTLDTDFSLVT